MWVADMTYIWTTEGWLYLAVILDLFSRRVVGWSMAKHMRTEVVLTALEAALGQRHPAPSGLLFHWLGHLKLLKMFKRLNVEFTNCLN